MKLTGWLANRADSPAEFDVTELADEFGKSPWSKREGRLDRTLTLWLATGEHPDAPAPGKNLAWEWNRANTDAFDALVSLVIEKRRGSA